MNALCTFTAYESKNYWRVRDHQSMSVEKEQKEPRRVNCRRVHDNSWIANAADGIVLYTPISRF